MSIRLLFARPLLRRPQPPCSITLRHASSRRRPLASLSSSSETSPSPRTTIDDASDPSTLPVVRPEAPSSSFIARPLTNKDGVAVTRTSGPHEDLPLPKIHYAGDMKEHVTGDFKRWMAPALPWYIFGIATAALLANAEWAIEQLKVEYWDLDYPASLWENCMPPGTGAESTTFGFELENEDWTGGIGGGTSSDMGWQDRAVLRSCWAKMDRGPEVGYAQKLEELDIWKNWGQPILDLPANPGIGQHITRDEPLVEKAGDIHSVDKTFQEAIERTAAEGVWFPPRLSPSDTDTPLPLPPTALTSPRTPRPSKTLGITLLLRHARVWETMALPEAFRAASEVYERVLRAVDGWEGAETLEANLARRLSDLSAMTGEEEKGKEWALWGIERLVGWDQAQLNPITSIPQTQKPVSLPTPPPTTKTKSSWWPFSSSRSISSEPSEPSEPLTFSPPSVHPPISALLSLPIATTLPPSRTRQLLSLLQSLSKLESSTDSLQSALETQTASLQFVSHLLPPKSTPLTLTEQQSNHIPAEKLHNLVLHLAQSVFALHLAEVSFALRSSGSSSNMPQTPTDLLLSSYQNAVAIHHHLTKPSLFSPPSSHLLSPYTLSSSDRITHTPTPYYSSHAFLSSPSSDLVTSTRKTAASACHLLSSLALLSADAPTSDPNREKEELLRARSAAAGAMFWESNKKSDSRQSGLMAALLASTPSEGPAWIGYEADFKAVETELVAKGYLEAESEAEVAKEEEKRKAKSVDLVTGFLGLMGR